MSGSDPTLLDQMAAFWVEYDAESDPVEKQRIERRWLVQHGGHAVDVHNLRKGENIGEIRGGLHPVRAL